MSGWFLVAKPANDPCYLAARQLKAGNTGLPACGTGSLSDGGVVLVHLPEGAVIDRVDVHRGVVTPARVGGGLHT